MGRKLDTIYALGNYVHEIILKLLRPESNKTPDTRMILEPRTPKSHVDANIGNPLYIRTFTVPLSIQSPAYAPGVYSF